MRSAAHLSKISGVTRLCFGTGGRRRPVNYASCRALADSLLMPATAPPLIVFCMME
ncbi:hypothetical protein D3C76_481160 [compost metagenome]